jgi:hypothetical protein
LVQRPLLWEPEFDLLVSTLQISCWGFFVHLRCSGGTLSTDSASVSSSPSPLAPASLVGFPMAGNWSSGPSSPQREELAPVQGTWLMVPSSKRAPFSAAFRTISGSLI